jgi:hypothetical protein
MDYFAGLDISMDETHVCIVDREGEVVYERKTASTAQTIADELAKAPSCRRIAARETGGGTAVVADARRPRGLGGSVACSFVLGVAAVTIETAYREQETRY